ncbi:hypothetical protein Tco_0731216, partial [Tanacetum coccineum]
EKVNLPSPEPTVSCFDDLDFFKDFENEFPTIVYNDAQTSKSDLLTESILSPRHIDEFDLNDETSLSEYDEEEQNILCFNDLFSFNFGIPFDPKRYYKDGDCARMLRRPRYEGLQYIDADIEEFEARLARIYKREVHRVQVFNFRGLPNLMANGLSARMLMKHRDAQGVSLFTSRAWRQLFCGKLEGGLNSLPLFNLRFGEAVTDLDTTGALQFQLGGVRRRLSWRQFCNIRQFLKF